MASTRRSPLSKVDVLYLSYGAMIALLALSVIQAYRAQGVASRHSVEIEQRFVQKGAMLSRIRRALSLATTQARELIVSKRTAAAAVGSQFQRLEGDTNEALSTLDQLSGPNPTFAELRAQVRQFWRALDSMIEWSEHKRAAEGLAFLEREIVPRRDTAAEQLTVLADANQSALETSEAEFVGGRRHAAAVLLLTLWLLMVLGFTIAWLSLLYTAALERESAQRLAEIMRAREELQRLSERLLEIQEDERRRISRELHDEIGQTLTALRIELSRADSAGPGGAGFNLEHARALAERTIQTVRNISLLLRPALLDDLGLAPALQWHAEEFSRRSGIRCAFSEEGLEDSLPDAHKTCVYRIVQEALHNCEKHAAASNARICLRQHAGELTVTIEDDGRGFDPGKPGAASGLGLLGMKERAATLRGALSIESAPGKGARLRLVLPLPDQLAQSATAAAGPSEAGA